MSETIYGQEIWQQDSNAAFEEASRRINAVLAQTEKYTTLFLSDLYALKKLPPTLEKCRRLKTLSIGNANGPNGEDFNFYGQRRTIDNWSILSNLHSLQVINLSRTDISDLTPIAKLNALQQLDCRNTQVSDLTPIAKLNALQQLDCSDTQVRDLTPIAKLNTLQQLNCSSTQVRDLTPIAKLNALQQLHCWNTQVRDLTPIAKLNALQQLNCSDTQVSDLSPISKLNALQQLNCSDTQVSDLSPIAKLNALQQLHCWNTQVRNLSPIAKLNALQQLHCWSTQVRDLSPIAKLNALQQLDCRNTQVSDLTPIANLSALQQLDCSGTQVSDLTPIAKFSALQQLHCWSTQVSDLTPIAKLNALQQLNCSDTQVSDLTPIAKLNALQQLHCWSTQVSDLTPIANLSALQQLHCWNTQVRDLMPIAKLNALQQLYCSDTRVSDLTPMAKLNALQQLDCSGIQVSDLTPIAKLNALQTLNCSDTKVSDLTPIAKLNALQKLNCSNTKVSDLSPIAKLNALRQLHCWNTAVSNISPLLFLPELREVDLERCVIETAPNEVWLKPSLKKVVAYQSEISGMPSDILSQSNIENCLAAIRAHLHDLGSAPETLNDIKLFVLGNGRIGKTQICNRLSGGDFDANADSTHGIRTLSFPVPQSSSNFSAWDFGGQDLYFGTHALFLRSRAIFLIVWTPESDTMKTHEFEGMIFKNQPMVWWLNYVHRFGNSKSPLILVQNKLDCNIDQGDHPALADFRQEFKYCKSIAFSAKTDEGRRALDGYLNEAAKRFNAPLIGAGRLEVLRKIQKIQKQGRSPTLTFSAFETVCKEAGNVSNPQQFLQFLHNAGIVFWREGFFNNHLILDQNFVLDAIYTVFNRKKCKNHLEASNGHFTQNDLASWVWNEKKYSYQEQKLFIDYMLSCSICFTFREGTEYLAAEYIAPDFLPESWESEEREERWGTEAADTELKCDYESLPPTLIRNLICAIGSDAGQRSAYWQHGLYGYRSDLKTKFLIEQQIAEDWSGTISIEARGGRSRDLALQLSGLLQQEEVRLGISRLQEDSKETYRDVEAKSEEKSVEPDVPEYGYEPREARTYFISYAWADRSAQSDRNREDIVNEFCDRARKRGIVVQRDKDVLKTGARISEFMDRMAQGDEVIVVLSEKYLRSEFCMYELFEIWQHAQQDEKRFLQQVRVFAHEDAQINRLNDRISRAAYWQSQYTETEALIKEHGSDIVGEKAYAKHRLVGKYYRNISDILETIADVVLPQTLDELIDYSFDD